MPSCYYGRMNSLEGVKLAVWDLDGTLIDSYRVFRDVLVEAADLSGRTIPSEDVIRHNFHGSLDESIKGAFDMVDGEDFVVLLNDFLRIQERYYSQPEEHIFADARALVSRLGAMGVKQVVATNREHQGRGSASPHYLIENSSLKPFFEQVIPSDEAPARKPDARVLANVPELSELSPEQILVVGDQFVDATLAQNLGSRAVIVNRSDEPVPHMETFADARFITMVSSLEEVR